jgi:hypothetical protein
MKFLSTLAARSHHCSMFEGGETLKIVCEQVILPNLFLRESDIEEFEDNPLCVFFEPLVVAIYSQYIDAMQKVDLNLSGPFIFEFV